LWLPILVFLVPLIYYWPVLNSGFVSDDYFYHWVFNWTIRDYVQQISLISQGNLSYPFFRPIVFLSFQIDYLIWGADSVGFHFTNLLIHSTNTILLFYLARRLGLKEFGAAICALFFALYPANPEVVTWISGRFDLMVTMFTLLALHGWCTARIQNDLRWMIPGLICFILAMLSKENGVAAFLLLPLIDWMLHLKTRREWGQGVGFLWKWYIVWFAVLFSYLGFRLWLFHGDLGGYKNASNETSLINFDIADIWDKLFTGDLWMMITPVSRVLWPDWESWLQILLIAVGIASLLGLAAAIVHAVILARKSDNSNLIRIVSGILWIFLLLLPVISIGKVQGSLDYSRFLYYPCMGLALVIGTAVCIGWNSSRNLKYLTACLVVVFLVLSGFVLKRHNDTWIEAGVKAAYIAGVMDVATAEVPEGTILFVSNYPWLHKGAHCAPISFEGYVWYKYGTDRVDTYIVNWDPDEAADTWDNLGLNFNKPGVGFIWDPDTETITVLPLFTPEPIVSDTLETFIGIEIPPQGDVTDNPPEPPISVVGTENAVTEVEVLPEPV